MVAKSVYEDARSVLITPLNNEGQYETDPYGPQPPQGPFYAWLGTGPMLPLLQGQALTFIDYFPDRMIQQEGQPALPVGLAVNTLALDLGTAGREYEWEMGGMSAQDYTFNFAINAASDAIAMGLFQDLADHYMGRTADGIVPLYNYILATPIQIVRMEVDSFEYAKSTEEAAPGVQLWFAQLVVRDFIDQERV